MVMFFLARRTFVFFEESNLNTRIVPTPVSAQNINRRDTAQAMACQLPIKLNIYLISQIIKVSTIYRL